VNFLSSSVFQGAKALERTAKPVPLGLGFRVKSGWAVAVLLAGPRNAPKLVRCQTLLLSDPEIPQSKQPYHAVLGLPEKERKSLLRKLRKVVADALKKSLHELQRQATADGYRVAGAGLVVGSLVDPATLHNEHIRAHALEGQLFRTVLEEALGERGISAKVFLEKGAYLAASEVLGKSAAAAKRWIRGLGDFQEGSWRAEEKLAALAAWVALCREK
jgi:hypothetical protein